MAAAAHARQAAPAPQRREQTRRLPAAPRRAPQTRARAEQRARFRRAFVVFVICLSVLAVGRVALSFAVVQKSLQTDTVQREERSVTAENAQLAEELAQLSSTVRIRDIAEGQLGLVDASHVEYLKITHGPALSRVAEKP